MPPNPQSKSEIDDIFRGKSVPIIDHVEEKSKDKKLAKLKGKKKSKEGKSEKDKDKDKDKGNKDSSKIQKQQESNSKLDSNEISNGSERTEAKGKAKGNLKEKGTQETQPTLSKKGKKVQQIVDPSLGISNSTQSNTTKGADASKVGKRKELDSHDEEFRNSRGNSKRKKTEEGFAIFTEEELKINPESGGTKLCPFDCDCCF